MTEQDPYKKRKMELSRKTSAIYPEWAKLLRPIDLEKSFLSRAIRQSKRASISEKKVLRDTFAWVYDGQSPIFTISRSQTATDAKKRPYMILDELARLLATETIALFTPNDVRNASEIEVLPIAFKNDREKLEAFVAKDKQNGIIFLSR